MRARLLALALVVFLLLPFAPARGTAGPSISVVFDGPATVTVNDTFPQARLPFTVTNNGASEDYVTLPRGGIAWDDTGQMSLGYQSPEFGRALAPGASGPMWVTIQADASQTNPRLLDVQFNSLATGATITEKVPIQVVHTAQGTATLTLDVLDTQGRVIPSSTAVDVPLNGATSPPGAPGRMPMGGAGHFTIPLVPGAQDIRIDAPGYEGRSLFLNASATGTITKQVTLPPVPFVVANQSFTNTTVGDSIWHSAVSWGRSLVMTAPMTHSQFGTTTHFYGVNARGVAWNRTIPAVAQVPSQASQWQANDATTAIAPDGSTAAFVDWNGILHVVNATTGVELWTTSESSHVNPYYPAGNPFAVGFLTVGATAFSPNGSLLAAGGANGHLAVFQTQGGARLWSRDFPNEIRALAVSPNGSTLFVGSGDWLFHAVDLRSGREIWNASTQFWPFFFIAQDGAGHYVGEGGKDGVARVWNATTGAPAISIDLSPGFVTGIGIMPDADGIILSHWNLGVRAYARNGTLLWERPFPTAMVATTADGRFALVGSRGYDNAGHVDLIDANGSSIWTASTPPSAPLCGSNVSPFPQAQFQSVHVDDTTPGVVRIVATCIGGGVVMGSLGVEPNPAAAPSGSNGNTGGSGLGNGSVAGNTTPNKTGGSNGTKGNGSTSTSPGNQRTPAPSAVELSALVVVVAFLARRSRRGSP
ncbi:MAG: WD40 repeat domain-containing protein [Thermoplasmatota archaeon]